jgi:biotin/methionine sulfoxide reductase
MLGQIGLPGGGFGVGYGSMGTKGMRHAAAALRSIPTGNNPTGRFIPVSRIADMLLSPGEPYDFHGKRYTYPDIHMLLWGGGNPFHHHQDLNKLLRAWHNFLRFHTA